MTLLGAGTPGGVAPPYTFPQTSVLDEFTRANSTTGMGSNWSETFDFDDAEGTKYYGILSAEAYVVTTSYYGTWHWNPNTFGPDCEAYLTVAALPSGTSQEGIFVHARMTGVGDDATYDGYAFGFESEFDTYALQKFVNGTITNLATGSLMVGAGDKIGISCIGTTIKGWHRPMYGSWTQIASVTDAALGGAGYIGMYMDSFFGNPNVARVDDFGGGTVV